MGRIRQFFCSHWWAPSSIGPDGAQYRCLTCGKDGFFVKPGYSVATGTGTHYEADGTIRGPRR
jgi:hypothetical protein